MYEVRKYNSIEITRYNYGRNKVRYWCSNGMCPDYYTPDMYADLFDRGVRTGLYTEEEYDELQEEAIRKFFGN